MAGYNTGGLQDPTAGLAPPNASTTQVPNYQLELGGNSLALPVSTGVDLSKVDGDKLIKAWETQSEANRNLTAAQIGFGMINQFLGFIAQMRWFDAQETINDRRIEAQENISKDAKEVNLRYLEIAEKSDKRQNGPGGLKERLARIEAEQNIEMYDRKMDTQERIAAQKNLDQAFSYGSDYNYGNPYA